MDTIEVMQDEKDDNSDEKTEGDYKKTKYYLLQKQFRVQSKTFNINNEKSDNNDTKMFYLKFVDRSSENKHQIYEKIFTVQDCNNILTEAKCGAMNISNFVQCTLYCISDKNSKHQIKFNVKERGLQIVIIYKTEFVPFSFIFNIPKKNMNEIEILKLRVHECERTINNLRKQLSSVPMIYEPILISEIVTDSKRRNQGWNNIELNDSTPDNDDFVKLNVENGTIDIEKGVYIVEAHAESYNVQGLIIQLKSDDEQIIVNGIPSYSVTIGASRIIRQVMHVKKKCNIVFREYCKIASNHGVHYNVHWPKQELANIYVACVSIQKIK
eukprot:1489_1